MSAFNKVHNVCREYLLGVSSIVTLFMMLSCEKTPIARKASTMSHLKEVYYAMRILEADKSLNIDVQVDKADSRAITLQEKWAQLLLREAATLNASPEVIYSVLCRDAYGNLFNVEFKTNLISMSDVSSALRHIRFNLIVWSSGPNGINEYGKGDDVVLPIGEANK